MATPPSLSLSALPLAGLRLVLEPLRVEHAQEMAPLLDDAGLHVFIGGRPASRRELQEQYRSQVVGRSPNGLQCWLNWVLRRREDGRAVGTVQATVTEEQDEPVAEVAWVVAAPFQSRGYAREGAQLIVAWLRDQGVVTVRAHVHPEHAASQGVAQAVGLVKTSTVVDGEVRWEA